MSTTFSSELTPDALSRQLVLGTGALALLGGCWSIVVLPIEPGWRFAAAVAWSLAGVRDLRHIAKGYKLCKRLRVLAGGAVEIGPRDGCCLAARLCAGSVLVTGFGWLRIQLAGGRRYSLLVRRRAAQSEDWRRLQVIWRHLGAAD